MSGDSTSSKTSALLAIAAGGGIAGTLDLLQACNSYLDGAFRS